MKPILSFFVDKQDPHKNLKLGIWFYILLLIFEGALRKWIFPSLATPLLVVRDPLALFLIIVSLKENVLKPNIYWVSFIVLGFVSFITAILFGHSSLPVALFGARALLLQFPLIFVIGLTFNRNDVKKVGQFFIALLIPMTILTIIQFYSPQNAFVNRGVGGDMEGAGFGGALGYFRPPGTFSFINGLSIFYGLTSCFVFYSVLNPKIVPRWLLFLAILCTALSIPFTISRAVLFQNGICIIFLVVALIYKGKISKVIAFGCIGIISLAFLTSLPFMKTGIEVFTSRFESASVSEGGLQGTLINRTFGKLVEAIIEAPNKNFWGKGIGADTNVGLKLLGSHEDDRINDFEWSRIIYEIGPIFGILFIIVRVLLVTKLFKRCIIALKNNYTLPWMLFSLGGYTVLQGQMAQPTQLGFLVLFGGFIIASLRSNKIANVFIKRRKP